MTNQPLLNTYLIKPKNNNFVTGKASLPASLVFTEGILKIHKLIITIALFLTLVLPFTTGIGLLNLADFVEDLDKANFLKFLGNIVFIFGFINVIGTMSKLSIFHLFQLGYERWLAKRVLSKGGRIIEGLIQEIKYVIVPEGPDETVILFKLLTPDGNSIEGELCYIPGRRIRPFSGNTLKFLYLNNQCYFFL